MDTTLLKANWVLRFSEARAVLYEDIAAALRDGLDIVSYLSKRAERAATLRDPLGALYRIWLTRMDNMSFGRAVAGYIPAAEAMSIAAAENAANLDADLDYLAQMVRGIAAMKKTILLALVVPSMIFSIVAALITGFSYWFVPILVSVIKPQLWPASGQRLLAVAHFTTSYGVIVLAVGAVAVSGIIASFPRWIGPYRRIADDFPPYSLFRAYNGALMLMSMATLVKAGSALNKALERLGEQGSPWVRWHVRMMLQKLDSAGGRPGEVFDTGFLPKRVLHRIMDRAERADFETALHAIGTSVMTDLQREVEGHAKMVNVALLLAGGVTMAFLVIGFLDTVWSVQSALKTF